MPRTKQSARKSKKKNGSNKKNKNNRNNKKNSNRKNTNQSKVRKPAQNDYNLRERTPINYRSFKRKDIERSYDHYDSDEELEKLHRMELKFPGIGTDLFPETESDGEDEDVDIKPDTNTDTAIKQEPTDEVDEPMEDTRQSSGEPTVKPLETPSHGKEANDPSNVADKSQDTNSKEEKDRECDDAKSSAVPDSQSIEPKVEPQVEPKVEPIEKPEEQKQAQTEQQNVEDDDEYLRDNPFADVVQPTQSQHANDGDGISPHWDYEDLKLRKDKVFGIKYKWNLIAPHFEVDCLEHVLEAAFPCSPAQKSTNERILKQCIDGLMVKHQEKLDSAKVNAFRTFPEKYSVRFSDSILRFNGMAEEVHVRKNNQKHREIEGQEGRSVRVGIFENVANAENGEIAANTKNGEILKMMLVYADNKQFIEESQQYFGLQIGHFLYESRKWALADEPAWTTTKGEVVMEQWSDIALVLGISILNRLLNPWIPNRPNAIWKQQIVDVTELLPPFDDLESLLRNDAIWWEELEKRMKGEYDGDSEHSSEGSSYEGSLKDFIDDSLVEQKVDIIAVMDQHMFNGNNGGNTNNTMPPILAQYFKNYDEANDEDYQDSGRDDDADYAEYVDKDFKEDIKGLVQDVQVKEENEEESEKTKGAEGVGITPIAGQKRSLEEMKSKNDATANEKDDSDISSNFSPPPQKKQRTEGDDAIDAQSTDK